MIDVQFACGHTRRQTVHGDEAAQAKYIAKLSQSNCSSCWVKKQPIQFSLYPSTKGTVIYAKYAYPIRDTLYSRGYFFQKPSWRKRLASEEEKAAELQWISEQGYQVVEPTAEVDRG